MMKRMKKNDQTRNQGFRGGRLRTMLSGFLAVACAVSMMSGNVSIAMADDLSTELTLAGAGSGQDVTVRFGNGKNQSINLHVNPETSAVDETEAIVETESDVENVEETELYVESTEETEADVENVYETEADVENTEETEADVENIEETEADVENTEETEAETEREIIDPLVSYVDQFGDSIGEMYDSIPLPEFEAKLDLEKTENYVPVQNIYVKQGQPSSKAIEYSYLYATVNGDKVSAIRHNFDKSVEETDTETANSGNSEYSFTNDGDTWRDFTGNDSLLFWFTNGEKDEYTYEDENVKVTAKLQHAWAIPDGAELRVTEVTPDSTDYNYDAYMSALNQNEGSEEERLKYSQYNTLLYDIAFIAQKYDEGGNAIEGSEYEYEPAEGMVSVSVEFKDNKLEDSIDAKPEDDFSINHLSLTDEAKVDADTTAQAEGIKTHDIVIEPVSQSQVTVKENASETLVFEADSFSVFSFTNNNAYTPAWIGNQQISESDIASGLGVAGNFAIFANNFTNTDHVEGNIAVNNLYTNGTGYFDAGGNIYSTNKVGKITLTKTVIDGEDGTFYFKAVNNSGQTIGQYVITTNGGRGQVILDATTGDLSTALNSGSIVFYETDSTYGPSYKQGDKLGDFTVSYSSGSLGVEGNKVSTTSLNQYIKNIYLTDSTIDNSESLADILSHVLPGTNNVAYDTNQEPFGGNAYLGESIDEVAKEYGGQNHDQVVIKVENGTWYVNRKSGYSSPREYIFPTSASDIDIEKKLGSLKTYQSTLAMAADNDRLNKNTNLRVININGVKGELTSDLSAAGFSHVTDGSGIVSGLRDSGDFLLVNINIPNGMSTYKTNPFIVDGRLLDGAFNYYANHVMLNFVQGNNGSFSAYTGTVKMESQMSGIIFAPGATVKQGGVWGGFAVCETFIRNYGQEIHKSAFGEIHENQTHDVELTVSNTGSENQTTSVIVTKVWEDENKHLLGAEEVEKLVAKIKLYRREEGVQGAQISLVPSTERNDVEVILDASKNWTYTWTELPKKDEKGHEYTYYVKEEDVPADFKVSYSTKAGGNEEYGEAVQTNNESSPSAPAGENEASAGGGVASVTVTNSKKVYYSMPATGSEGTRSIYLVSLTLIALAGIGLVMIRRRQFIEKQ